MLPDPTLPVQRVPVRAKSPGLMTMLLTVTGLMSELTRNKTCWALKTPTGCVPKSRFVGEIWTGVGTTPAPVSSTIWGLSASLSVTVTDPLINPGDCGENITEKLQLPPAAIVVPEQPSEGI